MKTLTENTTIEMLQWWQGVIKHSNNEMDRLLEPLALSPESKLYDLICDLQKEYTNAVAKIVGDTNEWLTWHWYENDLGENEYGACPGEGHQHRKICSVEDLAQLIEESK